MGDGMNVGEGEGIASVDTATVACTEGGVAVSVAIL